MNMLKFPAALVTLACLGFGAAAALLPAHRASAAEVAGSSSRAAMHESPWLVNARDYYEAQAEIGFPKLVRGNPENKEIALTFDDGPHPQRTQELLDLLKDYNVRATFFLVGKMVDKYPELARRIAADGHEIANHTYSHRRLPALSDTGIESELHKGSRAIARAVGVSTRLFRPPGGEYDDDVIDAVKKLGLVMVLWTADPSDFRGLPASEIEDRIMDKVSNGGIILLHDGIPQTMDMLPDLIDRLRARGYRFVTCSELAREPGAIKVGGPRVRPRSRITRFLNPRPATSA